MKTRLEQLLNLSAAAVAFAAAFGLDSTVAMLSLSAINVGLAVAAGLPR
jgi:phosphotransacetylase